ncbi:hypothetical protein QEN19_003541 [Hanseniaspora menglaensis]
MSFNNQQQNSVCLPFARLGSCRYGINCLNTHTKPVNLEEMKIFVLLNLLPHDFLIEKTEREVEKIYLSLFNTFNKFGEVRDIIINTNNKSLFIDGNVYVQFANEGSLNVCLQKFSEALQFNGNFVEINVISQIKDLSEIVCKYYHQSNCTNDNCTGIHYHRFKEELWDIVDLNPNARKFTIRDKLILVSHKMWSSTSASNGRTYNSRQNNRNNIGYGNNHENRNINPKNYNRNNQRFSGFEMQR